MAVIPPQDDPSQHGRDRVAMVLALTVGIAVIIFTAAVMWDALFHASAGLSENATQVLTGVFSGIIGALAVYLGARLGGGRNGPPSTPGSEL